MPFCRVSYLCIIAKNLIAQYAKYRERRYMYGYHLRCMAGHLAVTEVIAGQQLTLTKSFAARAIQSGTRRFAGVLPESRVAVQGLDACRRSGTRQRPECGYALSACG